jgi:hypothetical protein
MNRIIIVDRVLRSKLDGLGEQVELCDESGKTLGHFLPTAAYRQLVYAWARSLMTDEEIEQARRETGGRTLAEIRTSLGWT